MLTAIAAELPQGLTRGQLLAILAILTNRQPPTPGELIAAVEAALAAAHERQEAAGVVQG